MAAYRVGLTGGLAAGKSTVGAELDAAGFRVIDADHLVADLYLPGGPGVEVVRELFGASVLDADGAPDRERIAAKIFADPQDRHRLESAIHPLVRNRFEEIAATTEGVVVLEATLLVEAGFAPDFDLIVTVEADTDLRTQRAIDRGLSSDAARARLAAQSPEATRVAVADIVIRNDGDRDQLRSEIANLIHTIHERAHG